jgi:hypothetical protein
MQELLNAFGAKQRVLQFLKIPSSSVIVQIVNHCHTFS